MEALDDPNFILDYLLANEMTGQTEGDFVQKSMSSTICAKDTLKDILDKMDTRLRCKEVYDAKCRAHNQNGLFNMLSFLPEFEISERMYEALTFRETLVVSEFMEPMGEAPTPVGGLCIDVQKAQGAQPIQRENEEYERKLLRNLEVNCGVLFKPNDSKLEFHTTMEGMAAGRVPIYEESLKLQNTHGAGKMVVHVASSFQVDGKNAGSKITSWVDRNLHTIEELRKEYVCQPQLEEQSLYVALKPRSYYLRHTHNTQNVDDRQLYSLQKAKDYVSEGASVILMRYLAIKRYIGSIELACAYINGAMCRNIYVCTGPESGMVNQKKMDVCKINRLIIEECGIQHKCSTLLTTEGQIVKQEWEGCDFVVHVNPCARLRNKKPAGNDDVLLKHNWEKDLQLMSTFLDQKALIHLQNKSYLMDHPEIKDIISDYVNATLLMKPTEVMDFTIKYFGSFVPHFLPRNEYLDEKFYM